VLQRDLDRLRAQELAEREAEALRNRPPPEPEVVADSDNPAESSAASPLSSVPMDVSGASTSGTQKSVPFSGAGSSHVARRQSTISLSTLNRPQFPHKLDLTSDALRISPAEFAQGLGGGLPSPVTLAPKSARPTTTSDLPPDFMAALTQPVDIDLTMLPEEATTTALDPSLGSSADRPIELDLEAMEIDMPDVKTLFGDEPASDISTTNLFGDTTSITGNNTASLLATFSSSPSQVTAPVPDTGGGEPPFDMNIDDNIDFSQFSFDPMSSTSDMGIIDMNTLLSMDSSSGNQTEGQGSAGDT
jgi:hypothetical protein